MMLAAIEAWFTTNLTTILYIVAVIILGILAWKTNFGRVLLNVLNVIVRLRVVIVIGFIAMIVLLIYLGVM